MTEIKHCDHQGHACIKCLLEASVALKIERDTWKRSSEIASAGMLEVSYECDQLKAALVNAKAMIDHALDLGYLGDGSTHGWAKDVLKEIRKLIGDGDE